MVGISGHKAGRFQPNLPLSSANPDKPIAFDGGRQGIAFNYGEGVLSF